MFKVGHYYISFIKSDLKELNRWFLVLKVARRLEIANEQYISDIVFLDYKGEIQQYRLTEKFYKDLNNV